MKGNAVPALKRKHPNLGPQQIAERTGLTRQRVWQILKGEGMTTRRIHRYCANCNAPMPRKDRKFCSSRCRAEFRRGITLTCDWCGGKFTRQRWDVKGKRKRGYKHHFCSKTCFYDYLRR